MAKHFCDFRDIDCSFCNVKIDNKHYSCQWGLEGELDCIIKCK